MTTSEAESRTSNRLAGARVAFLGKLAGMSKREAHGLVRSHGGTPIDRLDATVQLAVIGEHDLPLSDDGPLLDVDRLDDATRDAIARGELEVISETELWRRLGFVESQRNIHRLYTPAMLADLLGVPVSIIRRWHRRGLIVPAREVRKLPYFDFQEVATARRLSELLAAGVSPQAIEKKLAAMKSWLPGVERPLAQLSVIVEGKDLLLRQGEGLVETGGQLRLNFETEEAAPERTTPMIAADRPHAADQMMQLAAELEDAGQLELAAEMLRAALAAGGPNAEACFRIAELLYRCGDLCGARERYYMAIELDEDFVEARANLGCVLAELGEADLAIAAFEGALAYHEDYADVHYQLARVLEEQGRKEEAIEHWARFLQLAHDSPWAENARARLRDARPNSP